MDKIVFILQNGISAEAVIESRHKSFDGFNTKGEATAKFKSEQKVIIYRKDQDKTWRYVE